MVLPRLQKSLNLLYFPAILGIVFSFFSISQFAHAEALGKFIIQLNSPSDLIFLQQPAKNLTPLFQSSKAKQFQNVYSFSSNDSLATLKSNLSGHFKYIQSNNLVQTDAVTTTDPFFTANAQDVDKQWGLAKAGFTDAWSTTLGSQKNIVAVIDTGIDESHVDLRNVNFLPGYDFINNITIPSFGSSDDNGHGTLIAGILGATPNNGVGMAGTNWYISILPIKALDASGKGDAATVAQAIVWAADHGAQFINLSLGGIGFGHDVTLANAVSYAFNKGALIVAAAGNDVAVTGGSLDDNPVFPICDDNNANMIIGVAATDWNDVKPDFSNYGKACVDVTAPGRRILSTINYDPATHALAPNSYAYAAGTSVAVPFVVGEAALIKAEFPEATNIQIRDRIIATAYPIDALNPTQCGTSSCAGFLGSGRINALKSLASNFKPLVAEGDLVKTTDSYVIYEITGGQKRAVSQFVQTQRFSNTPVKIVTMQLLNTYPEGPYVTPNEGSLVKAGSSPTVYQIFNGEKLPVLFSIFRQRGYNFNDVKVLTDDEINSWIAGNLLTPQEGTVVKSPSSPSLYWVVGSQLHLLNSDFYHDRGLAAFPTKILPEQDLKGMAKGEAFIK